MLYISKLINHFIIKTTHKITVRKTAHYHQLGTPGKHIERFIIACHGYGQAPSRFINKFQDLDDGKTLVVAPEGLSKFYFGGFSGEVGASWMTKEHREDEISDYINYLQQIYDALIPQLSSQVNVTLFGFSQGGATQCRFAMLKKPVFHNLILWGSNFAHDLDFKGNQAFLEHKNVFLVLGNSDQFITPDQEEKYLKFASDQAIKHTLIKFEGKHEIIRKELLDLFNSL